MLSTEDFDFDLPKSFIAQTPLKHRSDSKLMVLERQSLKILHDRFFNLSNYLKPGDCLVLNDTRVIPARIYGHRHGKEEKIEFLLLNNINARVWECLVKPGKKTKIGTDIVFSDELSGTVRSIEPDGRRYIELIYEGDLEQILNNLGEMPLPPYIHEKLKDKERYQTVYNHVSGSAAAPTAGLHFTEEILEDIKNNGVNIVYITLHVGLGTFLPVKVDDVTDHKMHEEFYTVSNEAAKIIQETKNRGNRVIAVGTTSVRTLESVFKKYGQISPDSGWTDIFIYPGFKFGIVDAMITNFHLPKSTLIMLVSAFAGKDFIFEAYEKAKENNYRFFSFGDCMLIE